MGLFFRMGRSVSAPVKKFVRWLPFISLCLFCSTAHAETARPKRLAVFVFGLPGTPQFRIYFKKAWQELAPLLAANGFAADEQVLFSSFGCEESRGALCLDSNREIFETQIRKSASAGPYERVFIFMAGHANGHDDEALFQLPGPDVSYRDLMTRLNQLQTKSLLTVVAASQGSVWLQKFGGPGRAVIAGNGLREFDFIPLIFLKNFPAMFAKAARWHALHPQAAGSADPSEVSLAEVFFMTERSVRKWYEQNQLHPTEKPLMDADGNGQGVSRLTLAGPDAQDALIASKIHFKIPIMKGNPQ